MEKYYYFPYLRGSKIAPFLHVWLIDETLGTQLDVRSNNG